MWVRVDERLPESAEEVLLSTRSGWTSGIRHTYPSGQCVWFAADGTDLMDSEVSHWMAVPAPPEFVELKDRRKI